MGTNDGIDVLSTFTDIELIEELSSRHDRLIVIKPELKNPQFLKIYCSTPCKSDVSAPYELYTALAMLNDAVMGIIKDCFSNKQNFAGGEGDDGNENESENENDNDDDDILGGGENWKLG